MLNKELVDKLKCYNLKVGIFPNKLTGNTRFQTAEVASSAGMVLGSQMASHISGYIDVRPFQYIGSGELYLHDFDTSIDDYFNEGKHYIGYDSENINTILEKYDYFVKKHPKKGDKIRQAGFEYCQKNHSTKERIKQVIDIYKGDIC